jgi:hypothetical protein
MRGRVSLKWTSRKHHLRGSQGSQGSQGGVSAPESIQIGASQLPGRRRLSPLKLKEPYDIFPLPPSCFPRPQVYVEQHPAPALYLPFQLGLKGVPLAQKEAIDVFLSGTRAGRRGLAWKVTYLAVGPLSCVAPFFCFLSHEKCLLCSLHPVSPVLWGRALKEEGDSKKRPHMTLTDIKRPQAIAVVSKYLVYQGSSGVSVSRDTLCLMTPLTALEDEGMGA